MTRFAPPLIVRCPACDDLVTKQRFASINTSLYLFPPEFQAIAKGDLLCPHCKAVVETNELAPIEVLDAQWKRGVWAGIPEFDVTAD